MQDRIEAWMKHVEGVLIENQGHRLTTVVINGLLFAIGSTVGSIVPQQAPAAPEQPPVAKLIEPIKAFQAFGDVSFVATSMHKAIEHGLPALHAMHWQETEGYRNHVELQYDYERVQQFESIGRAQVFLMLNTRCAPGDLRAVGNGVCYFERSTHNGELVAIEDTLFVEPEFRKQGRADAFIGFIHEALQKAGIAEMRVETKLTNKVGRLLERRHGYEHVANRYSKRLDRPLYAPLRDAKEAA